MHEDLESLSKWLKFNKLKLNVTKNKYTIIRGSHLKAGAHNDLCNDDGPMEEVASMKYLKVHIDKRFIFKEHLNLTARKMTKKICFVGRVSKKLIHAKRKHGIWKWMIS
jgi:hypothetical protein